MSFVHFARPIVTVLVALAVAWQLGAWTLARVRSLSPIERALVATSLGLAEIAHAVFVIGLCGGLRQWILGPAAALVLIAAAPAAWRASPQAWHAAWRRPWWQRAGAALAVIALAALAARALFPPTAFDATMYHLPLVKGWVIDHRIAPALTLRYPVFAQLNEVLFATVFLFGGELAPHLIELALLALTCGLLFVWGRRWFSPRAGALAAALLLASPLVLYLSTVGYIDVGLMHFVTLGFFALARHGDDGERALVWIAGAALACAADCKYLGLFFFAPAGLWICATAFKRKTPRAPFELAAVVLLVALPFYGYIVWHARNPVFPFYGRWLGYGYWTAQQLHDNLGEMTSYGARPSLAHFVFIFRSLSEMPNAFHAEAPFSPIFFYLWPLAAVLAFWQPRIRVLFAITLSFLLFWMFQAQVVRYLLAALPMLCLLCAASLLHVLERLRYVGRALAGWPAAAALCLAACAPAYRWAWTDLRDRGAIPITAAERDAYLTARVPGYALIKRLNDSGAPYRVHGCLAEQLAYFADGELIGDHMGRFPYQALFDRVEAPHELFLYLRGLRADHLLMRSNALPFYVPSWSGYFPVVAESGGYTLFAMSYPDPFVNR